MANGLDNFRKCAWFYKPPACLRAGPFRSGIGGHTCKVSNIQHPQKIAPEPGQMYPSIVINSKKACTPMTLHHLLSKAKYLSLGFCLFASSCAFTCCSRLWFVLSNSKAAKRAGRKSWNRLGYGPRCCRVVHCDVAKNTVEPAMKLYFFRLRT